MLSFFSVYPESKRFWSQWFKLWSSQSQIAERRSLRKCHYSKFQIKKFLIRNLNLQSCYSLFAVWASSTLAFFSAIWRDLESVKQYIIQVIQSYNWKITKFQFNTKTKFLFGKIWKIIWKNVNCGCVLFDFSEILYFLLDVKCCIS